MAEQLLDAGDLGTLRRVQRALALSSHLSLALFFQRDDQSVVAPHPADLLQPLYFNAATRSRDWSRLPVPAVPLEDGFHRIEGPDGLTFLLFPFGFGTDDRGWVVAGPVPETPVDQDQVKKLALSLGVQDDTLREALSVHPSPVPRDLGQISESLET